eukprot:15455945-Alexandrium_andersonii.AAC.1
MGAAPVAEAVAPEAAAAPLAAGAAALACTSLFGSSGLRVASDSSESSCVAGAGGSRHRRTAARASRIAAGSPGPVPAWLVAGTVRSS